MDFDDFDNSSSSHGDKRHQLPRRSALSTRDNEEFDENLWDLGERDAASNIESGKKLAATDGDGSLFSAVRHRRTNPSVSEYSEMKQRILALERQLASSSNNEEDGMADKVRGADAQNEFEAILENGSEASAEQQKIIPQLCERTWSDFMNKHTGEKIEYALEILADDPEYYYQKSPTAKPDKRYGESRGAVAVADSKIDPKTSKLADGERPVPNRIRINSTLILKTLKNLDEHIDATGPMVMMRPFKFLVHYELQIKDSIRVMEQQLDVPETNTTSNGSRNGTFYAPLSMTREVLGLSKEKETQEETLQHMRCLADFMDRYVKPTVSRAEGTSNGKIQFKDLWYIFKPGVDIHIPLRAQDTSVTVDAMGITPETFQSRYNRLWRVTGTSGGRRNLSAAQTRNASLKSNAFKVDCYYIDFHGRYFCPTVHTFEIAPFKGDRDIASLDFYPARYMEISQQQQTLEEHVEKGKVIFDAMAHSFTHFFYSGPTLMVHPCGCPIRDGPTIQEHIESEVIVDFKMALRKHPSWQPQPELWKDPVIERRELQETFPVQYWTDHGKTKLESTEYDQVYNDYFIDRERSTIFKNNEQIFAPVPIGWSSNESMIPEKDILLLPSCVFAYVLRTRTFAPLWLAALQPIKAKSEGLNNLQLKDNTFKDTLRALVNTHFMQKLTQHSPNFEYDIVRGKGRGLVILLHGAPGVGKTFTAESVAAAIGQPLLQITCGDLGLKPKEVDTALKEIFHYAQHWKCVLLLDECDIFLTQRNKTDVKRNALVSVFLRVLEFYTGVLFLTTNRVGALDEAIKSRITWISYYPPLNWDQTKEIWKTNIKRVEKSNTNLDVDKNGIMKYARQHFKTCLAENAVWNGRRIQNAFKVAIALAHWEAYSREGHIQTEYLAAADDDDRRRSNLSATHFKSYAAGTRAFDAYFQETTGVNDAERAFDAMERADDYAPEVDTPIVSPRYEGNQFPPFSPPHDDLRRTSSASLAPPSAQGRGSSPNLRPQLPPRLSTSQLPQHQRSPALSRQSAAVAPAQTPKHRRRSSQLNTLTPVSSPVMRRRPSNEPRGALDHDFARQAQVEHDDSETESEEMDYLNGNESVDENSSSDD
ncbi:hypothetical protein EDD36DRAFT_461111 [Exophiala viscosa]|uniref:AAA+ ATPase domain-containing protein n=1 Tax=Exophiala viscosa TaxID=2486360 RepID=A0AAN6IG29_9EURO|nr:hypothetical protein EDD36DRAFT_461111 [Exophiala viscosa]